MLFTNYVINLIGGKFQAIGNILMKRRSEGLLAWSKVSDVRFNTLFYRIMLVINPLLGFGILAFIEFDILTISAFLLFLLLPFVLVGTKLATLNKIHSQVSKKSGLLLKYAKLFTLVTNEEYNSDLLNRIKGNIVGDISAYRAVSSLAKNYKINGLQVKYACRNIFKCFLFVGYTTGN